MGEERARLRPGADRPPNHGRPRAAPRRAGLCLVQPARFRRLSAERSARSRIRSRSPHETEAGIGLRAGFHSNGGRILSFPCGRRAGARISLRPGLPRDRGDLSREQPGLLGLVQARRDARRRRPRLFLHPSLARRRRGHRDWRLRLAARLFGLFLFRTRDGETLLRVARTRRARTERPPAGRGYFPPTSNRSAPSASPAG